MRRGVPPSGASRRALRGLGALAIGLCACGHQQAATRPASSSAKAERAPASASSRAAAPAASKADAGSEEITDFMAEHFAVATWARDAVINGNLDALRRPLRALADYRYASVAPGGWLGSIAKLQQAAGLTADAETLDVAAAGVAAMGRVCGSCHREQGGGPHFAGAERERSRPTSDTLGTRMVRHMWAADRFWEGLTGPSDDAWQAGAEALAHAPEAPPRADPPLPPRFVAALQNVRTLGQRALEASSDEERANVYGAFLASCAACHAYQVQLSF
jgi:mono/diheme cytochrome c family protein